MSYVPRPAGPNLRWAITVVLVIGFVCVLFWAAFAMNKVALGDGDNEANQLTFIAQAIAAISLATAILIARGASLARAATISVITWATATVVLFAVYVLFAFVLLGFTCHGDCIG